MPIRPDEYALEATGFESFPKDAGDDVLENDGSEAEFVFELGEEIGGIHIIEIGLFAKRVSPAKFGKHKSFIGTRAFASSGTANNSANSPSASHLLAFWYSSDDTIFLK